ncbi:MAG: hypothetical protein MZV64_27575 [Ignavibacteriales bacterium]|nr:hypothetical protein [Ignavibacteriales bacterium]
MKALLFLLSRAESIPELNQIKEELITQNIVKEANKTSKSKEKTERIILSEFISSDGRKIYLGKNNKQNEYLISKIASLMMSGCTRKIFRVLTF